MLVTISAPTSSALVTKEGVLIMSANSYFLRPWTINKSQLYLLPDIRNEEYLRLAEFDGKSNALFKMTNCGTFLGLDNKLLVSDDLRTWKKVLEAENCENMFWHMAETCDGTLFVQEYGSLSTGIYRSTDSGESWKQIASSKEIDRKAQHFHSVAYDQYRDLLIATLGDGNLVKIAMSDDHGETWKPLYTSAYQCLPIAILKDYVVFGMDSAISSGIVIWNPSENKWQTIHLRYSDKPTAMDIMQSADLRQSNNGTWIMSTGGGSILFSCDLKNWQIIYRGKKEVFESHMISNEYNGIVAVAMGHAAIIIDLKTLDKKHKGADVKQYHALFPRLKGLVYVVKRRMQYSIN